MKKNAIPHQHYQELREKSGSQSGPDKGLIMALILTLLCLILLWSNQDLSKVAPRSAGLLPDFSQYSQVAEKKAAFFDYLRPIIQQQNLKIKHQQALLKKYAADYQNNHFHQQSTIKKVRRLAVAYDVPLGGIEQMLAELELKIGIIPESLVLVQAANESAWGTSRFAVDANNLFGQWCFTKGCGLVPSSREEDANHSVKAFQSPADSVASYMKNLNTNRAYREMRELRYQRLQQGLPVTGKVMAQGLIRYSQRRQAYVDELIAMIEHNDLE